MTETTSLAPPVRRIRILHNTGHLLRGGIEMWLYQMIRRLDPARFEHHILVRSTEKEAFHDEFQSAGVKIIPCLNYRNPVLYGRNLWRVIRDNGPYDLLHTHGTHFDGYIVLLGKLFGVPCRIAHSHTDTRPMISAHNAFYQLYAGLGHSLTRRLATHGLGASDAAARSMFGENWSQDQRWGLLYYGIDFRPFGEPSGDVRSEIGISPGHFVIGHVGRFEEQKNHKFLLKVAKEVCRRSDRAHFLLIGDGSLRESFLEQVRRAALENRFTFVRDCTTIPRYMTSAMDCFVFPSLYEGLGLVAVEAQAAGLPCVISDMVPDEAAVDPNIVSVLPLSASVETWATRLLELEKAPRSKPVDLTLFERSRFNIDECVRLLAAIYERGVRPKIERTRGAEPAANYGTDPLL